MVELIAAFVEAILGLITAALECIPAVLEVLAYIAIGSITIFAYAISGRFRERKRLEWRQRPKRKYLDLGASSACFAVLVVVGVWIFFPPSKSAQPRGDFVAEEAQRDGEIRLVISGRSDQHPNELKITVKKGMIAKLLHRKSARESGEGIHEGVSVPDGSPATPTNQTQSNGQVNGSSFGTGQQQ